MSIKIEYNSYGNTTDGTNFCSGMETQAENMIEDNENDSTIVYPSSENWITQRTDDYIIKSETMRLILPSNIYKLKKILVKIYGESIGNQNFDEYVNALGEHIYSVDITKYVVSEDIYNSLSSKGFDLYSDYDKNIKENTGTYSGNKIDLSGSYKEFWQTKNVLQHIISSALCNYYGDYSNGSYDIYNIMESFTIGENAFKTLKFRVEYVPISTKTKLRARKSAKTAQEYMQPYNQRAEVNSASAFGKSMYLSAQKTGVEEITVVKTVKHINEILPLGCLVKHEGKQYIISGRNIQVTNTVTAKVTYTLSQNWTNKSKHVSVDQKYRNYNIPQDIVWRNLYWEDFIEVTTDGVVSGDGVKYGSLSGSSVENGKILSQLFYGNHSNDLTVTNLFMHEGGADGASVTVPCSAMGVANSLVFTASMKDNLSAGLRISATNAEYCDEVYYCRKDGTFGGNTLQVELSDGINNFNANSYPQSGYITGDNIPKNVLFDKIYYVDKDPGEAIKFTYQCHFVTDEPSIIIGNKIAENHPLVKKWETDRKFIFLALNNKIRAGTEKVNSSDTDYKIFGDGSAIFSVSEYDRGVSDNYFHYFTITLLQNTVNALSGYNAWAITDENNNLYVGCNDITKTTLYFTHIHKRKK